MQGAEGERRGWLTPGVAGIGAASLLADAGVAYAGLAVAHANLAALGSAFIVAGIAIGAVETAEHSMVAAHSVPSARGSAFGLLAAIQSLGNLIASAVAGLLWTTFSPMVAFWYAAACMCVAAGALLTMRRLPAAAERG